MNFNIVENKKPSYLEKYEEFVELYNTPCIKADEIRKKLDLNLRNYSRCRKLAIEEGRITPRKTPTRKKPVKNNRRPCYYTRDSVTGKYKVMKRVNGKLTYFGYYDSVDSAKERVEELKACNWQKKT